MSAEEANRKHVVLDVKRVHSPGRPDVYRMTGKISLEDFVTMDDDEIADESLYEKQKKYLVESLLEKCLSYCAESGMLEPYLRKAYKEGYERCKTGKKPYFRTLKKIEGDAIK